MVDNDDWWSLMVIMWFNGWEWWFIVVKQCDKPNPVWFNRREWWIMLVKLSLHINLTVLQLQLFNIHTRKVKFKRNQLIWGWLESPTSKWWLLGLVAPWFRIPAGTFFQRRGIEIIRTNSAHHTLIHVARATRRRRERRLWLVTGHSAKRRRPMGSGPQGAML